MFWKKPSRDAKPEWLIVGLGNPGGEYAGTRHNVGFRVIDQLSEQVHARPSRGRHRAVVRSALIGGAPVLLVKPLTFMNLSGQAVASIAREHQLPPQQILVVADDLDLPVGKVKLKPKGSSGGNRGHKSIIASLRSEDYPRIKIGIGKVDKASTVDHVLSKFDRDELPLIEDAVRLAIDGCIAVVEQGLERATSLVNSRGD